MISKLIEFLRNNKTTPFFIIIILLSTVTSFPNYFRIPIAGTADLIKFGIHFIILTSAIIGILTLIATHRWLFFVLFPPLLFLCFTSAASLYFFNITVTSEILEVILKTDWSVSKEFISLQFILLLILLLLIIIFVVRLRFNINPLKIKTKISIIAISLLMILPSIVLDKKRQNTIISRVPFSLISAAKDYRLAIEASQRERIPIGEDAVYVGEDSLIVILILGESLRNDHLSINGYNRNTTPLLSQREVYSFKNNKSLYTYTAASVPQILTRADAIHPERAFSEESVLSIFQHVGFKTIWIANQVPDYTYASLAKKCDEYINLSANSNTYSDIISTDQNILNDVDKHLTHQSSTKKLLILHTIGSHWYYNYRCPEKMRQFFPITESRSFSNNRNEQMINS